MRVNSKPRSQQSISDAGRSSPGIAAARLTVRNSLRISPTPLASASGQSEQFGRFQMRDLFRAAAGLALLAASASAATNATAQTGTPSPDAAAPPPAAAAGPGLTLTPDQAQALRKTLANIAKQPAAPDLDSSVGASVPDGMTLTPMPPEAAQVVPGAQGHHVAKTDDGLILIVNPINRQVVGVIAVTDDGMTGRGGTPDVAPSSPQDASPSSPQ